MGYHVRVADWARGRRINLYVKSILLPQFRQMGYRKAWVYTTANNLRSQKGIERAGWVFAEGYRAYDFGTFCLPLPGKLSQKLPVIPLEHG